MMINKNCALIVLLLLVLVALPRSTESVFSRLKKRSTDDGICEETTAGFCSKIILFWYESLRKEDWKCNKLFDKNGLLGRFNPDTSQQIQNHFGNATTNCKVLLCLMSLYTVLVEGEKHFPNTFLIDDEAFINVIKSTNLVECNDKMNNQNSIDTPTTISTSIITNYDKLKSDSTTVDFNNLSETTVTQQDTQSIKSNEIDGSLNESKQTTRKGIIDILYTNENYTDAAKSKDVNEQSDRKLVKNKYQGKEYVSVVNLDNQLINNLNESTIGPDEGAEDERPDEPIDIANRISDDVIRTTTNTRRSNLNSELDYSSTVASTTFPIEKSTDSTSTDVSTESLISGSTTTSDPANGDEAGISNSPEIEFSSSKSEISQVGNIIFQLLGETGYNKFYCNLTTGDEDDSYNENGYRRINKFENKVNSKFDTLHSSNNDTLERIEFQPIDDDELPKIPENLADDLRIRKIFLKFNIFELCNFTNDDQHNWTENVLNKLNLCSDAIGTLNIDVDDTKTKMIFQKYSQDIQIAAKKLKIIQEAKVKVIRVINLTDYLSSTIKVDDIPRDLKSSFDELKQFLLVELRNEDLSTFHPDSNRKDMFMTQLFDYLLQSKVVDQKYKKLLETFKKYIHSSY